MHGKGSAFMGPEYSSVQFTTPVTPICASFCTCQGIGQAPKMTVLSTLSHQRLQEALKRAPCLKVRGPCTASGSGVQVDTAAVGALVGVNPQGGFCTVFKMGHNGMDCRERGGVKPTTGTVTGRRWTQHLNHLPVQHSGTASTTGWRDNTMPKTYGKTFLQRAKQFNALQQ